MKLSGQVFLYFLGIKKWIKMFEQIYFHNIFNFSFMPTRVLIFPWRSCLIRSFLFQTQKLFWNIFVQTGLLNLLMLVLTSETILKYYCLDGLLVLTSESILEYFCPEGFAQSVYACYDLRNDFKMFLSRRVACLVLRKYCKVSLSRRIYSIHSCLFCTQKLF